MPSGLEENARQRLVVVFGLPGSGKSTVARRLARRLEATWLSSDALRSEAGLRGDYSKESIATVYRKMMDRADEELLDGHSVVLDGSFSSAKYRRQARELALAHGLPLVLIRMVANEEVALERVSRKRRLTEAGPRAYRLLKQHFEAIDDEHLVLDSSRMPIPSLVSRALGYAERQAQRLA